MIESELSRYAEALDRIHNSPEPFGRAFWEILLKNWFTDLYTLLLSNIYNRGHKRVATNTESSTLLDLPQIYNCMSFSQSREYFKKTDWHDNIILILRYHELYNRFDAFPLVSPNNQGRNKKGNLPIVRMLLLISRLVCGKTYVQYPYSRAESLYLQLLLHSFSPSLSVILQDFNVSYDARKRESFNSTLNDLRISGNPDCGQQAIDYILTSALPSLYLESWPLLEARIRPFYDKINSIYLTSSLTEPLNIISAACRASGKSVIVHQHGGAYFMLDPNSLDAHELTLASNFLTYGYNPFNSCVTGGFQRKQTHIVRNTASIPVTRKPSLCYILTSFPKVYYRVVGFPQGPEIKRYRQSIMQSICSISDMHPDVSFALRLYRQKSKDELELWSSFASSTRRPINAYMPSETFGLIRDSSNYTLMICTTPTTVLSDLACNSQCPFMVLLCEESWGLSESFKQDFAHFYNVGIFHSSYLSLTDKLMDIDFSINNWWSSPEIKTARIRLRSLVASNPTSIRQLAALFKSLINT